MPITLERAENGTDGAGIRTSNSQRWCDELVFALLDVIEHQTFEHAHVVPRECLMRLERFGLERIDGWRVDADQHHTMLIEVVDQRGRKAGEVVVPVSRIGKRTGAQENARRGDDFALEMLGGDALA